MGTKGESNDSPLLKALLSEIFCSRGKKDEQVSEAGDQHSSKQHVFNEWEGENVVTCRVAACRARYEKRSVGAVINHSAQRGGDDLMEHH